MRCPFCKAANDDGAEACFICGKALFVLTHGAVLASRYEIVGSLGQGGMSRVYKGHDRVLSETVAIKVLRCELSWDPVLAARFLSEIKLARKVSHRNVCRIHEYGEDRGLRFISMEFIEGTNLKDRLQNGSLPTSEAFQVVLQVAEGLKAVHDHGIIHRDLKTSNIMIDTRGTVKLMDFGIAKQAEVDTDWSIGSGNCHVVGTPEYMSPEQARGGKLDFRSDIYSLGCVVFEIFTGRAPFKGQTPVATLFKHVNEPPPLDGAELPKALLPVLEKSLAKKPEDRFASSQEFIAALRVAQVAVDPEGPRTHPFMAPVLEATGTDSARGRREPSPCESASPSTPPSVDTFTLARAWPQADSGSVPLAESRKAGPAILHHHLPWAAALTLAGAVALALRTGSGRPLTAPQASASREEGPPAPATLAAGSAQATLAPLTTTPPAKAAGFPTRGSVLPGETEPAAGLVRGASTRGASFEGAPRPAPSPGATAEMPDAASSRGAAQGTLTLLVVPASEVTVDGVSLGTLSRQEIPLSVGEHTLRILHPSYEPLQRKIHVRSGESQRLVLDLAEKGIRRAP